jgi:3',5'-cyclic AMP phosphodiesterase CpdA
MTYKNHEHSKGNAKKNITYILVIVVIILLVWNIYTFFYKKDAPIYTGKDSGKDKTIYVASDIHYLSEKLTDNGIAYQKYISSGDGKQLNYIDEIMDAFVSDIKQSKPDILIVSGDLTNNGEKESHLDLAEKFKAIEKSGTAVYVIPGNHDISNPWAREFKKDKQYVAEYINDTDFSKIYASFGYDEAISKDEGSLSYLAAPSDKLWLLMLDTNKYKDNISVGVPSADGLLKSGTLEWIAKCCKLAKDNGANIITVMHHNILNHSEIIQDGYTLNNSGQVLPLLKENQINLVLSGHIHVQDISSDHKEANPLYDIASGALSVYPHLFGILKYSSENNSLDYSTLSVDVNAWAKSNHIKDKNLLDFSNYSKNYFSEMAYNKAFKSLTESNYSEEQVKLMADTIKTLNLRYFSGTENLNSKDVVNSEGYKLWADFPESFLKSYVASIISDRDTDDNKLFIKLNTITSEPAE